jgi:uncharacterized membrane protein
VIDVGTSNAIRTMGDRMIVLSAFLHHLAAFTLVATLAIEFVLIRQELTLTTARRLTITDVIFGASAGVLLVVGLFVSSFSRRARRTISPATHFSGSLRCS